MLLARHNNLVSGGLGEIGDDLKLDVAIFRECVVEGEKMGKFV